MFVKINRMSTEKLAQVSIGEQIKSALLEASKSDGLKRTQRWLAQRINMGEVALSNKMANVKDNSFTKDELDKINEALNTSIGM